MKHRLHQLDNGIKTLFIDSPGHKAASVQAWFRAGSALESKDDQGIAHFLEHMFFKGTPTRPGAGIAHEVESFGGELNAFTSFDYTCYYINSPHKNLHNSLNILLDMISSPSFKEEDFVAERQVVFEEFRRSQDNPHNYAFGQLQTQSFKGGYSHPILGPEKNIKVFSKDQLSRFRNAHYNLSNLLFVVAGNLEDEKEITQIMESYSLPKGPSSAFPKFKLKPKGSIGVHKKDVRMAQMTMAIEASMFKESGAAAEEMAMNALAYGELSPLYQDLVTKTSLANSVGHSTMFMNHGGVHFIKMNFPYENLEKVLNTFSKTYTDFIKKGPHKKGIERLKNQYLASKVYEKESLEAYAFSLGHSYAQSGDIEADSNFLKRIKDCTELEIHQALKDISLRPLHVNVQIGPEGHKSETKKILESFKKGLDQKLKVASRPIALLKKEEPSLHGKKSKFDPSAELIEVRPGIKLLYRHNPLSPTFVLHTYIEGGLSYETKSTSGLFNILSSLLTKGHSKASYKKVREDLDFYSASLNGMAGKNAYGLTLHGQSDHFKTLVEHFTHSLISPKFLKKHFNHEVKLAKREILSKQADPVRQCLQRVSNLMFGNHSYALNILGNEISLAKLTEDKLLKVHRKHLKTKEIAITYCGNLTKEQVIKELNPFLKSLPARKKGPSTLTKATPLKESLALMDFDREQTHIFIGAPCGNLSSKDHLTLKMFNSHLSGQSSELFIEVRDRQGLCYAAQSIHFSALEAGYWGIYIGSGHDKAHLAIAALESILQKRAVDGLSKKEFDRVKKMMAGQSELALQTNDDYAHLYTAPILFGLGMDYPHKLQKKIDDLSYESFQKSIKSFLKRPRKLVAVGKDVRDLEASWSKS